jgi:hypothetical protein
MANSPHQADRERASSSRHRAADEPHIVEEHRVIDEYGDAHVEATDDLGRHWYQLRPRQRRGYDLGGFGAFWWAVFWIIIIALIIWGWGWGWAT